MSTSQKQGPVSGKVKVKGEWVILTPYHSVSSLLIGTAHNTASGQFTAPMKMPSMIKIRCTLPCTIQFNR